MENNELNTNEFEQNVKMEEMTRYKIPRQENANVSDVKENGNVTMGAVGAVVGALLGVAIWMLIFHLGYIAAIGGIAIVFFAIKGYEMLGGNMTTKGAVIVLIICVVMVYVANYLSWSMEIYLELEKVGGASFGEVIQHTRDVVEEANLYGDYIKDLILGFVLSALGASGMVKNMFYASK